MFMRAEGLERHIEGPDDGLLASLRSALRPEPLPPALSERIHADFDWRCAPTRRFGLPAIHVIGLAAAACVIVAVFLPLQRAPRPSDSFAAVSLTSDEAAEIVAAYAALSWDSPLDWTFDAVEASLDSVERSLRPEAGSSTVLPWGSDDNWDVPAATEGGPGVSPGGAHGQAPAASEPAPWQPGGAMCFAERDGRYHG